MLTPPEMSGLKPTSLRRLVRKIAVNTRSLIKKIFKFCRKNMKEANKANIMWLMRQK